MDYMTILFTSLIVLSHQQHLVPTKRVWSLGSVRLRWCECNHLTSMWTKSADETSLNSWSRFASKRTLVRFAWDVKANASRSDPVLKSIRLFGRNRHPLSRTHYGNYSLISGNSKTSSKLSDRQGIWTDTHIKHLTKVHTCSRIYNK